MFKAIVLDLFDTLVNWDPDGLPVMHWKGRDLHSTLPWILPKVAEALGKKYDLETFMTTYGAVYDEINEERERDGIEITCLERFVRTLQRLGLKNGDNVEHLAEELTRIHMRGVRSVTSAPAARKEAVRRLAPQAPLPIVASPLRRTRETAVAFEREWGVIARIEPRVAEIPSPISDLARRAAWLKTIMPAQWSTLDDALKVWRASVLTALAELQSDTVVVSHFIAINAAVGHAAADDRLVSFEPDNGSCTVLDISGGRFAVVTLGAQHATGVI